MLSLSNIYLSLPRSPPLSPKTFNFDLSTVEKRLLEGGGVIELYKKHKNAMFRAVVGAPLADDTTPAA